MKTITKWIEALAFDAKADSEHIVRLDTTIEDGSLNSGMNPKKMLLASLSGCSGMDVAYILKQKKVVYSILEIEAEAEQTEEHPKVFKFVNMVYRVDAKPEDMEKVKRAVDQSHEKFCGISAMLSRHCPITYSIELV